MSNIEAGKVRTRFAPSPTGYLHVGGVRTALFNYLFARQHGGEFILRIEDTDQTRSTEESIAQILEGMKWMGLDWDGPVTRQTERFAAYKSHVDRLLSEGNAYRCTCSPEELDAKRKLAMAEGRKPQYDGTCRNRNDISPDGPHVIRFKSPAEGATTFTDLVRGDMSVNNAEIDDLIIWRTDGTPTYNLSVAIDDAEMGISHVIRGDDHLANTPRQVQLYEALGYPIPKFAHIPMILGPDKARLSKRHGAASILEYREMGYLPEAVINYIARLGWSYGDQEIFSMKELIDCFSLDRVGRSPAVFDTEKLDWLNTHYIKNGDDLALTQAIKPFLSKDSISVEDKDIIVGIPSLKQRSRNLLEMAQGTEYYLLDEIKYEEESASKFLTEDNLPYIKKVEERLLLLDLVSHETLEKLFNEVCEETNTKLGTIAQPVRVALTGKKVSPGIYDVIQVLGRDRSIKRLQSAEKMIKAKPFPAEGK
ncbi:MAG: glutamate--tRNA ligase [Nitrospinota bacterium]|nr:glutamate--tRNA ligase [Nitrospinota bacterium]